MGRHKKITDEALLEVARAVFRAEGAGASAKRVAERAGVSEAAVFKRFATKQALFVAAMAPPAVPVDGICAEAVGDDRAAVEETARRLMDYMRAVVPSHLALATNPGIALADVMAEFGPQRMAALAGMLTDFLARRSAAPDPAAAARLLIAAVHSLAVYEEMKLHPGVDFSAALPGFVATLWSGIGPGETKGD